MRTHSHRPSLLPYLGLTDLEIYWAQTGKLHKWSKHVKLIKLFSLKKKRDGVVATVSLDIRMYVVLIHVSSVKIGVVLMCIVLWQSWLIEVTEPHLSVGRIKIKKSKKEEWRESFNDGGGDDDRD